MTSATTIGQYLIERLHAHGVRHIFGIPGDYVLTFYDQLQRSSIRVINTCDEQGAGFAADAYARVRGLGAVCVTYCVGGLKMTNTTVMGDDCVGVHSGECFSRSERRLTLRTYTEGVPT